MQISVRVLVQFWSLFPWFWSGFFYCTSLSLFPGSGSSFLSNLGGDKGILSYSLEIRGMGTCTGTCTCLKKIGHPRISGSPCSKFEIGHPRNSDIGDSHTTKIWGMFRSVQVLHVFFNTCSVYEGLKPHLPEAGPEAPLSRSVEFWELISQYKISSFRV